MPYSRQPAPIYPCLHPACPYPLIQSASLTGGEQQAGVILPAEHLALVSHSRLTRCAPYRLIPYR
jgi:hypothetical protein